MQPLDEHLVELARRVSDHSSVDWDLEEQNTPEADTAPFVRALHEIAEISAFHQTYQPRWWGELELIEQLGEGTAARVFRARDPKLNREVALKLFHARWQHDKELLLREGSRQARVTDDNVVRIYWAEEHQGQVGFIMELVDGKTLQQIVIEEGPRAVGDAIQLGLNVCDALFAIHKEELIHGDIKAQNAMRASSGRYKLMDFSSSQALDPATEQPQATFGTPLYMAPELLSGNVQSVASDLYAVGVLLFYVVSGKFPVEAHSVDELRVAHGKGQRRYLEDVCPGTPEGFTRAVERALSTEPARRFSSAEEMREALEQLDSSGEQLDASPAADGKQIGFAKLAAIARLLAYAGGGAALVGFLGFICSVAYHSSLQIPPQFYAEGSTDYFTWGVRALVPCLYYMMRVFVPMGILVALTWIARRNADVDRRYRAWKARTRRRFEALDHATLGGGYAFAGLAVLLGITWYFRELLEVLANLWSARAASDLDVSILLWRHADYQMAHTELLSVFVLLFALGAWRTASYLSTANASSSILTVFKLGALVVLVAALVMAVLPYRVVWHNRAELTSFNGRNAYVIGRNSPEVFLYVPTDPDTIRLTVDEDDPRIEWNNERQFVDIFEGQ